MFDRVCYQLPFGVLGLLVHRLWIKNKLETIFSYRAKRLGERFGQQINDKTFP